MINYVALATAIILSIIAGAYSVVGLATIFSGAFWSVVVMGAALEGAKVVSVSWLSRNWNTCPKLIKYYLCTAVVMLMLITSMGTFGYLSKAHLAQTAAVNQSSLQVQPLEYQVQLEERKLKNAQMSLDTLDRLVNQADDARAVRIRKNQLSERRNINSQINDSIGKIQNLNATLLPLRVKTQAAEAEIGPLKYIAELIYGEQAKSHFDEAVRFVIMLIVIVFDPLAMVLLIASNHGFKPTNRVKFNATTGKLEVNKSF